MKTLKEAIEAAKCRKGAARGTTEAGAYWLAGAAINIRSTGGDGIGNNAADVDFILSFRHYRSGDVEAVVCRESWHQNHGRSADYESIPSLLGCQTAEEVIVTLKGHRFGDRECEEECYREYCKDALTAALVSLGLPEAAPSPDDVTP